MILKQGRYLDENFADYENGLYVIEAPQGSGKTERLKDLYDKEIILMGARNRLGQATIDRLDFMESTHLKDEEQGITHSAEELQQFRKFFINVASGHKLTFPPELDKHNPEYLIVDEALMVYEFIFNSEIVSYSSYQEMKARLIHTPKVILMGARFPEWLLEELQNVSQHRKDKNFQHIKYEYNFLEGTEIQFVSNGNELDNEIAEVMDRRLEGKGNRFLLRDELATDPRHTYSPAYKEGKRYPKGVLIVSERGESVEGVRAKWKEEYPEANIVSIWSNTSQEYDYLLKELGDPESFTDVDMIITSPAWGVGINIRNFADLTVGDYAHVPQIIQTDEQILQAMCRDRDCTRWVIHPRKTEQVHIRNSFIGNLNERDVLLQHFEKLGISREAFYIRDPITNESEPQDIDYIKVMIHCTQNTKHSKERRWPLFEETVKELGAEISKTYKKAITRKLSPLERNKKWENPEYVSEAVAGMKKEELTDKDKFIWDNRNKLKDRMRARKDLDMKAWLSQNHGLASEKDIFLIHELISDTRELFMNITDEENIIWLEIFNETPIWKRLKKDRHKINILLQRRGWYITLKDDTELAPLNFLKEVLEEFNYYSLIVAGVSQTRKELQAQVKKDNLTAFNKWKKLQDRTHLRIQDYLFESLAKGEIQLNSLSFKTRTYLKQFPHIVIENLDGVNHA